MPYRDLEPISKQLTIVVGLTVVGFMAFGLALSFYRNVLFEETLQNISGQNSTLKGTITGGYQDLEYYRSTQYKDKYAKESLGKLSPGEKVLIITKSLIPLVPGESSDDVSAEQQAAFDEILRQMPIIEHWKLYLFHRDKVEALKRGV